MFVAVVAIPAACGRATEPPSPVAPEASTAARVAAPSDADLARVRTVLDTDGKIQAIKLYREITGCGLAEAKSAVDAMDQYPSGDVADRPDATVWVESRVSRVDGQLRLDVEKDHVVVRDATGETHPHWIPMASTIKTKVGQSGDENSASQDVKGTVTYTVLTQQAVRPDGGRTTGFVSCTFEFTGESVPGSDGVRWWRLKRVGRPDASHDAGKK